jgi:hypothetical protein
MTIKGFSSLNSITKNVHLDMSQLFHLPQIGGNKQEEECES